MNSCSTLSFMTAIAICFVSSFPIIAQDNVILELESTSKGVLIPRMSTDDRYNMGYPVPNGLLVFDTVTQSFWYHIAEYQTWVEISVANQDQAISDRDGDTRVDTEESLDEDKVRVYSKGNPMAIINSTGVGIGKEALGELLEVNGAVQVSGSQSPNPAAGTIQWTGNDFEGYDGNTWKSFTYANNQNTVTDIDGNTYLTVQIGTQTWMKENLRTSRYRDGTPIANVTDDTAWGNLTTGAFCWYDNNRENEYPYGKLYNGYVAVDTRGVCPTGWHIPDTTEIRTLVNYLGGESVAGGKMKIYDSALWEAPNTGADNSSGFTGLAGGYRSVFFDVIFFINMNISGNYWTTTQFVIGSEIYLFYVGLNNDNASPIFNEDFVDSKIGYSIRCLKD